MGSMAAAYSCNPSFQLQTSCLIVAKPARKILMLHQSQVQVKRVVTHPQPIRSSPKNKVFEDQSQGIICYRDDDGEIICEGCDEGPRCLAQSSRTAYQSRDAEILDLLQRSCLQLVQAGEEDHEKITAPHERLMMMIKWSEFNKL